MHGFGECSDLVADSRIAMNCKKGDPSLCENNRPICVLPTLYKILGSMLKQRILDVGADDFLWKSQYAFRKGHSTLEVIFVARRTVEFALTKQDMSEWWRLIGNGPLTESTSLVYWMRYAVLAHQAVLCRWWDASLKLGNSL